MINSILVAMANPMTLWYAIVGILLAFLIGHSLARHRHAAARHHHHFIELGRERDMFFIPGDPGKDQEYEDDID